MKYVDPDGRENFIIQPGDTLSELVYNHNKKYGTNYSLEEIAAFNNITDINKIYAGDMINLPILKKQPELSCKPYKIINNSDDMSTKSFKLSSFIYNSLLISENILGGINNTFSWITVLNNDLYNSSYMYELSRLADDYGPVVGRIGLSIDIAKWIYNPTQENCDNLSISVLGMISPEVSVFCSIVYPYYKYMLNEGYEWNGFFFHKKNDMQTLYLEYMLWN